MMKLEHNFTIPAPVDTVWRALRDPERIAPCFPGATITSAGGDEFAGTVKVRLGPISLQYNGSGRFIETDDVAHRTVIEASGSASGGQSTAAASVVATLAEDGDGTAVKVATQLSITGKPAQFGRGLMEDVGKKIIGQFAENLASTLGPEQQPAPQAPAPVEPAPAAASPVAAETPAATAVVPEATSAAAQASAPAPLTEEPAPAVPSAPARPAPRSAADEIDLLDAAGGAVAKRIAPVIGGVTVLFLVFRWWRRR
ncbi:MAG: SRPBCC family protein [Pseudonocardiaceae bacterium]